MLLAKFIVYGSIGLTLEVVFTGVCAALFERDRAATGRTYLWMFPIYGGAALLLEQVYPIVAPVPLLVRGLAYVGVIFVVEYLSGLVLRRVIGRCPWDYGCRGLSVHGLIRLDYAPAWFFAGLLFEYARPAVWAAAQALWPVGAMDVLGVLLP